MKNEIKLHIDKRAAAIVAASEGMNDEDMLTTVQTAAWLGVSEMFLIKGRTEGYGPPYVRVSPQVVRYLRGGVRGWLRERTYRYFGDEARGAA